MKSLIRKITLFVCALALSTASMQAAITVTANRSTLTDNFNSSTHSVSWTVNPANHVTFTLAGDGLKKEKWAGKYYFYLSGLVTEDREYTLTWKINSKDNSGNAAYTINVTKLVFDIDRASGGGSYLKVGNGEKSSNLYYSWNVPSEGVASGTMNEGENGSIKTIFYKPNSYSQISVNNIKVTYTLVPVINFTNTKTVPVTICDAHKQYLNLSECASLADKSGHISLSYSMLGTNASDARIENGKFYAYKAGTYTVRASVAAVTGCHDANTQDFTITVEPVALTLTAPSTSAITHHQTLSKSTLTGGAASVGGCEIDGTWAWQDPTTVPGIGTGSYPVVFTPKENAANYNSSFVTYATVTVNRAQMVFEADGDWSKPTNWSGEALPTADDDVIVNGDVVIKGDVTVHSLTINEGHAATVQNGTLTVLEQKEGTVGGKLIMEAQLGNLKQSATSGQIIGVEKMNVSEVYFDLSFDPSGAITFGWYDFTVPFTVNLDGGISRINSTCDKVMACNTDFLIMEADEQNRANGGKGWHLFNSGVLKPGKLYTITFDENVNQNTFRFKWNGNGSINNGATYAAQYATGGDGSKNGWNGIGNGMLQHGYLAKSYKMQAYDHETNVYELITGNKTFAVGSAFFIQVDQAGDVDWTVAAATKSRPLFAPQHETIETEEFLLSLSQAEDTSAVDHLYFSASDEATEEYVISHDLLKMGTPAESKVARMWSTKGGKNLCDVEATLSRNKATAPLSLFAPEAGMFELAVEETPDNATLYLTCNGSVIWNLSMSPYEIELPQGTTEGYGLRMVVESQQVSTDLENEDMFEKSNGVRKVLIDGTMYIVTPEGAMYDINGKFIK